MPPHGQLKLNAHLRLQPCGRLDCKYASFMENWSTPHKQDRAMTLVRILNLKIKRQKSMVFAIFSALENTTNLLC